MAAEIPKNRPQLIYTPKTPLQMSDFNKICIYLDWNYTREYDKSIKNFVGFIYTMKIQDGRRNLHQKFDQISKYH